MADHHSDYLKAQVEMHRGLADVYRHKRYAPEFSMVYQRHWNRTLCDLAELDEAAVALDLGCGTGILFEELAQRGFRAVGLDLSHEMLAAAANTRIGRVQADGCRMPFADECFDVVFCRGSIHHLPDLEAAFEEIARVLRRGGSLCFSEPSNDSLFNRISRKLMYRLSDEFHEEDEGFRRHEIVPMLERIGFEIEVSRGLGFVAYALSGFPDKLGVMNHVPGSTRLTRLFIAVDTILEGVPGLRRLSAHWQVRARKRSRGSGLVQAVIRA